MKILLIQSRGGHAENREFREALCLKRALNRIPGIEGIVWGKGYNNFTISYDKMMEGCDAALLVENYPKKNWLPDMSNTKKLKLYWIVDAHINCKRHLNTANNNKINITLNSTCSYIKHFKAQRRKSLWFPNCYPIDLIKPVNVPKKFDVGFCGNYVNRKKWIDLLSKKFKLRRDIFVIGQSMVKAICSYKIHFNKNYSKDINYRTFETLGCRTLLMTNNTDRLKDLFTIGKHLVVYNSFEDCCKKIRFLLINPKKLNEIADAGYKHVSKNHTYDNRAQRLVNIIKENI